MGHCDLCEAIAKTYKSIRWLHSRDDGRARAVKMQEAAAGHRDKCRASYTLVACKPLLLSILSVGSSAVCIGGAGRAFGNSHKGFDENRVEYTIGEWNRVQIGANSYFFQEGEDEKYADAKYGGVRIDEKGNSVLVGLYDSNRRKIE